MPTKQPYKPHQNGYATQIHLWPSWQRRPVFAVLLAVLLFLLIGFVGVKSYFTIIQSMQIDEPLPSEKLISVEGVGRVNVVPDMATVTVGVESSGETVELAQTENSNVNNQLLASIKGLGIADDDIQTSSYNVYEDEYWDPMTGEMMSSGWIVSQNVTVTVRDIELVSGLLEIAGRGGSTSVYGLDYKVEDKSSFKKQARAAAIADAASHAEQIASSLDVEIEEVTGYSEWLQSDDYYPIYYADSAEGLGGSAPKIEEGTEEIALNVTITYRLSD
ncbi:MAG: SIMPL domain-containing protein [Patescibacteria group bacterium]